MIHHTLGPPQLLYSEPLKDEDKEDNHSISFTGVQTLFNNSTGRQQVS